MLVYILQIKNTIWEGGMRVAACVWSPLVERRVSADLMYVSDWLPTLYEAAGKARLVVFIYFPFDSEKSRIPPKY